MHLRPLAAVLAVAAFSLVAATNARSSMLVGRGQTAVKLTVNGSGQALVTFGGRRLLASGAVNARMPSAGVPQVAFKIRYGGKLAGGTCGAYDGPQLTWLVAACKAPDGSYWALQRWQRLRPNYGGTTGAFELRLSHWTGD